MGHKKKKGKHGTQRSSEVQPLPVFEYKKRGVLSTGTKILLAVFVIIIIGGVAYWQLSSQSGQSVQQPPVPPYPQTVAGIFYSSPTITSGGTKASLPYSFVDTKKLVFLDLKLENQTDELTYQGRSIPLNLYRNGEYLPLLIISTPLQKVISGIRVCEPCGSFSFHIVQGKYLDCDACHTTWNIETLIGISGGCTDYPPLKLTSSVGNSIEIDLSPLGIKVTP